MKGILTLILLGAIWGASFLFMKVAAGVLGPAVLIEVRVLLGALTLATVGWVLKRKLEFMKYKKHFFIMGLFSSALPFLLVAYAAQTLDASLLAILNSTAPIWGVIVGVIWFKTRVKPAVWVGCGLGVAGVVTLVGFDSTNLTAANALPLLAAILSPCCFGIVSHYVKKAPQLPPFTYAHGSLWSSVIFVLPFTLFMPINEPPTVSIITAVLILGVICTGVAHILYFNLVEEMGPSSALTVTFLIPIFGIVWGHIFLDEVIGINTILGGMLVLLGVCFVTSVVGKLRLPKSAVS
ncbi:DMT family transporter (plasmid) [Pseudoalteromonas sp. T1lg65]|uniref:DMT family transporter n=1 Tax=Pseudoalteromonas sp. T1lg65 TaxID=2077101 RepID=UPI003F7A9B5A